MCTTLNYDESKNCTCKLAQFCKRRQQLESDGTRAAAFFAEDAIKINSLIPEVAPVYQLIPIASRSATN
jgi:hypothetical protein